MTPTSSNPFSTKFTRPGAIPPLTETGDPIDLNDLLARLASLGGIAAIVGPHGSGKTTLLLALEKSLAEDSWLCRTIRLGDGWWKDARVVVAAIFRCGRGNVLFVDGWERLGPVTAATIHLVARLFGHRLLVTAHAPGTIPTLVECKTTPALLSCIQQRLNGRVAPVDAREVDRAFRAAKGDIREALFDLYDRFEEARERQASVCCEGDGA